MTAPLLPLDLIGEDRARSIAARPLRRIVADRLGNGVVWVGVVQQ